MNYFASRGTAAGNALSLETDLNLMRKVMGEDERWMAVSSYVTRTAAGGAPDKAIGMAATLAPDSRRAQLIQNTLRQWAEQDAAAARTFVTTSPLLKDGERQQLLQGIQH